jgi:NADP-dependent 3-hydroxy acid dehydrogenase YdfG
LPQRPFHGDRHPRLDRLCCDCHWRYDFSHLASIYISFFHPTTSLTTTSTGNSGIGYQTSLQLALRHARVYIAGRSEERVNKAIEEMQRTAGTIQLDLRFLQLNLQNLKAVKAAAVAFKEKEERLDILINNAGVCPYISMV